jgi:hypothetical protein
MKIAQNIQDFITEEKQNNTSPTKNKNNLKVWKVISIAVSFFVGTIVFISLLSMFLTGFK